MFRFEYENTGAFYSRIILLKNDELEKKNSTCAPIHVKISYSYASKSGSMSPKMVAAHERLFKLIKIENLRDVASRRYKFH